MIYVLYVSNMMDPTRMTHDETEVTVVYLDRSEGATAEHPFVWRPSRRGSHPSHPGSSEGRRAHRSAQNSVVF